MRFQWIIVVTVFFCVADCGGSAKQTADLLQDVRAFNEGVRWQKFPQSAVRILPAERDAFLDMREDLEEELKIDDFEITRMKMTGEDRGEADVQIKWTWHMDSQGIVRTTTSGQHWKRYGKRWMMLKEFHVRGHEMPGLEEKSEANDVDDESEQNAEEAAATEIRGANRDIAPSSPTNINGIRFHADRSVRRALHVKQNPHTIAE